MIAALSIAATLVALALVVTLKSVHRIGPAQVGLVTKKLGLKNLENDNPIAFLGEAGYQADLLMPGLRFKLWPVFSVARFPWVQVPAGEIAVVGQAGQVRRDGHAVHGTGRWTPFWPPPVTNTPRSAKFPNSGW